MDDGAFDQNFTWYEWGFVSPSDVPSEDLTVPTTETWPPYQNAGMAHSAWPTAQSFTEDRRWST
jgi:hypothetical protein